MDTVTFLRRLIAFETTSHLSNLALIEDCANYLTSWQLKPWLSYNEEKTKANLFVTIAAADGSHEGGLILSGHTDVVPTEGQKWQSNPYMASIREDKIYGRGSADMKGFIACVLAAVPAMKQAKLRKPLHIALSYDEEVGCLGVPVMLQELRQRGLNPDSCLVGEPTSMRLVVAHKGIHTFKCRIHGKAAHSSLTPQCINAIDYAAKLINHINEMAHQLQTRSDLDLAFDVPYSTLSVNTINGGNAINIVPQSCEFEFDYRNLPHMTIDDIIKPLQKHIQHVLQPKMQAIDANAHIELLAQTSVPAMPEAKSRHLRELMTKLLGNAVHTKVAYATEGGQFQQMGIDTMICGPGSITQAHRADEYIELSQIEQCDVFLQKLIAAYRL